MKTVYIPGYQGEIFKTDQGTLLLFMGDEKWIGVWPGMSWDTFYDQYYPKYTQMSSQRNIPTIWIGRFINYCRPAIIIGRYREYNYLIQHSRYEEAKRLIIKPQCNNVSKYKHCSFECWYSLEQQILSDDIKYNLYHGQDPSASYNKFLRFEAVFKPLKNKWVRYREK
jgi:hypothetical protein